MNSIPERYESMSDAARHALRDVKQATRESLLQPISEGAREIAHQAQSGCHAMAESTRHEFERIEMWASKHPTRALGVAFAAGVVLSLALFRR